MKKICFVLICLFLSLAVSYPIQAREGLRDDQRYHIVSIDQKGAYEILVSKETYEEAKQAYDTEKNNSSSNLGLTYGATFLYVEQGIVVFDRNEECSITVNYTRSVDQESGYTNGCYGADAAFLEYDAENDQVTFLLSGVIGLADAQDVSIYPIENVKDRNAYFIENGELYHHIVTDVNSENNSNLPLAAAMDELKENISYNSYDAHYFYDDYKKMIQDYRRGVRAQAVNADAPFYAYFQYLTHRSVSTYTQADIENYFKMLGIQDTISTFYDQDNYIHDIVTQSLLPQTIPSFLQYQNQFSVNALLMLSLSMNETAMGRSYLAYTKNNLFGHAAYDSAPELRASRYRTLDASIYSHALHYLNETYLNPEQFQYYGGFLGDKNAGMNVKYASDPYWGEKAAQYAYQLDKALGGKDLNRYSIGISGKNAITIYEQASKKSKSLMQLPKGTTFSHILLEKLHNEEGSWYRVQMDAAKGTNKEKAETYRFSSDAGYVKAELIDTILHSEKIENKSYVPITFDAQDGTFYPEGQSITLQVETGTLPSMTAPEKDHALFQGWDQELSPATEAVTYHAVYKAVKNIELSQLPETTYLPGSIIDPAGGILQVHFQDGSSAQVPLTYEMLSRFVADEEDMQEITIQYAGCETSYTVQMDKEKQEQQDQQLQKLQTLLDDFEKQETPSATLKTALEDLYQGTTTLPVQTLSKNQTRTLDKLLSQYVQPENVMIDDRFYDLELSGIAMGLDTKHHFYNAFLPKTIRFTVDDTISSTQQELAEKVANANHMHIEGSFTITGKDDLNTLQLKDDLVFSIQKPTDQQDRRYSIYYIQNKDIVQLPTEQTETRISFTNHALGSYVLVSTTATDLKEGKDNIEVYQQSSNGIDHLQRFRNAAIMIIVLFAAGTGFLIYKNKKKRM